MSERQCDEKCQFCNAYFNSNVDMNIHLDAYGKYLHDEEQLAKLNRIRWKPSDYDDGDICPADKDPTLARAVRENGSITLGSYNYTLSQNGKWLKRRRC